MSEARPSTGSLRNAAIAEIRRRIITGELPAELTFSEATISEQLQMSRAPVREALIVLNQLGWVTSQPRSGYLVTPMTLNELRDLFTMRALLEPRAAAVAARHIQTQDGERDALHDFSHDRDDPSDPDWTDRHYRYHRRITVLALNRELDRTISEVLLKLERYLLLDSVHQALITEPCDHRALTDAILSGNAKAAADACALHISQAQLALTEAILDTDNIRSVSLAHPLQHKPGGRPTGRARPA